MNLSASHGPVNDSGVLTVSELNYYLGKQLIDINVKTGAKSFMIRTSFQISNYLPVVCSSLANYKKLTSSMLEKFIFFFDQVFTI